MKESPACSKQAREEAVWTAGAGSQKQPPSAPHWSHEVSCPWRFGGHPRTSGQAPILEATTPWEPQEIPKGHPETSRTRPPPQDLQMNPGCTQAPKQSQICAPPPPSLRAPPSLGPGTNLLPPGFAGSILEQVILYTVGAQSLPFPPLHPPWGIESYLVGLGQCPEVAMCAAPRGLGQPHFETGGSKLSPSFRK